MFNENLIKFQVRKEFYYSNALINKNLKEQEGISSGLKTFK